MEKSSQASICILPDHQKIGGPASFQARLTRGLAEQGWLVVHDPRQADCSAVLVIAGSKRLDLLGWAKHRKIRIIQRLNGMNWTHKKTRTGLKHYLRSEAINWIMAHTRRRLADGIVYQSAFTQGWWNSVFGSLETPSHVIHNGTELDVYKPVQTEVPPTETVRILIIEGHLGGGHQLGFHNAIAGCNELIPLLSKGLELVVVGDVPQDLRAAYQHLPWITWRGVVERSRIPSLCRTSHLYLPCELNAACPNSLIEALACGTPVVGFDTGSIHELVGDQAGIVVPYGANDQELEPAASSAWAQAALSVIKNNPRFRAAARQWAMRHFDAREMTARYIQVLAGK